MVNKSEAEIDVLIFIIKHYNNIKLHIQIFLSLDNIPDKIWLRT